MSRWSTMCTAQGPLTYVSTYHFLVTTYVSAVPVPQPECRAAEHWNLYSTNCHAAQGLTLAKSVASQCS